MRRQLLRASFLGVAIAFVVVCCGLELAAHSTTAQATVAPERYSAAGTVLRDVTYSPASDEKLDMYMPGRPGPHPVIVWAHGGGWTEGSKDTQPVPDYLMDQVERRNFVVVSIDYRLAGRGADGAPVNVFPAALDDVKTAIRFLKADAARYDLDPNIVILAGHSAGGHLAALAGASAATGHLEPHELPASLARVDSTVQAVVDVSGPSDLGTWGALPTMWTAKPVAAFLGCPAWTSGPAGCGPLQYAAASVGTYVTSQSPPAFFAYGARDPLVPPETQGAPLAARWTAAKGSADVVYDVVADQGHDIDRDGIDVAALDAFLDRVLAGSPR
jgi:acetyl esterase/lipase